LYYFEARRYGALYIDGQEHGLEFFAFLHVDAYNFDIFRVGISRPDEKQEYLDLLMHTAMHYRPNVPVTINDRIVLLSTCSPNSTNGRDILVAKITDQVEADPFATELSNLQAIPVIDELVSFWNQMSLWMRVCVVTILTLMIALTIILTYKKRKRR
jgi:sortase B